MPSTAGRWDAILAHDIPGLHLRRGVPPAPEGPIAVQSAVAGRAAPTRARASSPPTTHWPAGRAGRAGRRPSAGGSTTRPAGCGARLAVVGHADPSYTARVVAADHPVCAGITDFDAHRRALLLPGVRGRRRAAPAHRRVDGRPAVHVDVRARRRRRGRCARLPRPPAGERPLAWATVAERSPVVYVQPGDSAATFALERLPPAHRQRARLGGVADAAPPMGRRDAPSTTR